MSLLKIGKYCNKNKRFSEKDFMLILNEAPLYLLRKLGVKSRYIQHEKIEGIVTKAVMDINSFLIPDEEYTLHISWQRKGIRIIFHYLFDTQRKKNICKAEITYVLTKEGKLTRGDLFDDLSLTPLAQSYKHETGNEEMHF